MIDYYSELSLDESLSTAELRDKIGVQRFQWEQRASRAGAGSEKAKRKIEIISEALQAFEDDDARESYDIALLRARAVNQAEKTEIDWLDRAWSYYFMSEFGPAEIAARYARAAVENSPGPYVVSAWIEIALFSSVEERGLQGQAKKAQHLKNARAFADEALVLDELSEDTTEVHHVRGVVLYCQGEKDKALRSYERAVKSASGVDKAIIRARAMLVLLDLNRIYDACEMAFILLSSAEVLGREQLGEILADVYKVIDAYARGVRACDELLNKFGQDSIPSSVKATISNYLLTKRREYAARDEREVQIKLELSQLRQRLEEVQHELEQLPKELGEVSWFWFFFSLSLGLVVIERLDLNVLWHIFLGGPLFLLSLGFGGLVADSRNGRIRNSRLKMQENIKVLEKEEEKLLSELGDQSWTRKLGGFS
ncbi:hypothetical protein [Buchananella hordeovulneris]|uniref:hypothetical protein n=1 Tax=Buchananella hordeovulneris TaxID=52770 RepID=UPI001161311A|nr:hypothetical protein [Buchananella hordeovulneris]